MITTLLLIAAFPIVVASAPQGCNEVYNYYEYTEPGFHYASSAVFRAYTQQNQSMVTITNITKTSSTHVIKYCVKANFNDKNLYCNSELYGDISFPLENATFILEAETDPNQFMVVGYGVLDEGSLSFPLGQLFSADQPCVTVAVNNTHEQYVYNFTQCCTSFVPVPEFPIDQPRCTSFKSRTTIYNEDDNYSIYATSNVNYTIIGYTLQLHGELTGLTDEWVVYSLNNVDDCEVSASTSVTCTFEIPYGDVKLLLSMKPANHTVKATNVLAGRLIIRNNQTLMAEGVAFTPTNECQYFSKRFSTTQIAATSFCCTSF